ncbi:DUF3842 family protein [Clostridium thermarum]|uniref:DUF3842 family protein n=1 Tax=Clostridium thermarum TaxID=1716543 RepID=UPI0013D1BAE5|nr:DUF3842 family protein [Clostridium thermarum]
MRIAIMDGQGAGLGKSIIKRLRKEFDNNIYIIALGTNTIATSNMVRAGANVGITGAKAICSFCDNKKVEALIGPIGVLCNGALDGEITAEMSSAIFNLDCKKYILPLKMHGFYIPGTINLQIKDMIEEIVCDLKGLEKFIL